MPTAAPHPALPPTERLARIVEGLCNAVAARGVGGRLTAALLFLLWGRLRRTVIRVRRLAARIAAGDPLIPRHRIQPPRPGREPPPRLPRGHAWLVRLAPGTAACGTQLQHLLGDPAMAALAETAPMRRLLRPLCRMLGVPPPPIPKRQPGTPPPADPAPPRPRPARPAWPDAGEQGARRGSARAPARAGHSPAAA